ncbi:hypothetical protein E2C01_055703 [Portunus trituberculatus]|uniref:Uncharacterized protein n=1 Tax=Portunus trituberculatus TaxID=210409 RepID=A0A5B7GVR3_PORTR|nr:hypothetical protein [Portunus trituberculatus]
MEKNTKIAGQKRINVGRQGKARRGEERRGEARRGGAGARRDGTGRSWERQGAAEDWEGD